MGTECLYSCNRNPQAQNYSLNPSVYSKPSYSNKPSEDVTHQDISLHMTDSMSIGKLLSTTLRKNRNLQNHCNQMSKFQKSVNSHKSVDNVLNLNFTLTSWKPSQSKILSQSKVINQNNQGFSQENNNQNVNKNERRVEAAATFGRDQISKASQIKKRKSLQIFQSDQMQISSRWQMRDFQFLRKDFLRIIKVNPTTLYNFKSKLGQGAQGTVYLSVNRKTLEQRAIKVIPKQNIKNQQDFFAEFQTLKILDHPNIVKLYEIIEHNSHYYLVTEYCDGGQVIEEVKRMKRFSEQQVARIMRDLMTTVAYIHQNNIIHRDLKLQNICFERRRKNSSEELPPIKIIDFGTSKFLKTEQNETLQTPAEVLNDRYNNKCDVWSCGIIMYILLSGRPPFRGYTHKNVYNKIQFSPVNFSDKIWENISNAPKQLIQRMLEKNSKLRISAAQVLNSDWIRDCKVSETVGLDVLRDMQKFYFKDKLNAVVMTYLTSNTMSQNRRRDLAEVFMEIDENHNGSLEFTELVQAYKRIYAKVDDTHIRAIFNNIDTDDSGRIDFTEFLVAAEKQQKLLHKVYLQRAFEFFDNSKCGFLNISDLKMMLGESNDFEARKLMSQLDLNHDNLISEDQFIKRLLKNRSDN